MMTLCNDIRRQLGRALLEERHHQQKEIWFVCRHTGITPRALDNIELGHKVANWKTYRRLLEYYNVQCNIILIDN